VRIVSLNKFNFSFVFSLLRAQSGFCNLKGSAETHQELLDLIAKLRSLNELPNLAAVYTNFASYFFGCNEFKKVTVSPFLMGSLLYFVPSNSILAVHIAYGK